MVYLHGFPVEMDMWDGNPNFRYIVGDIMWHIIYIVTDNYLEHHLEKKNLKIVTAGMF